MFRLLYTEQAKEDLLATQRYIARESGSSKVAYAFIKKLREKCKELASIKGVIGRNRCDIVAGLRSQAFGNYVIFFRYVDDVFQVVTIIEGHRDIETHFEVN